MAAVRELDEVIQTVVAMLGNFEEWKLELETFVNVFINGKGIVSLLPTRFGKRLIY